MLPQEIIRKKRDKQTLTTAEINEFITGVTDGTIVDAQTAALTMAIFLNGMTKEETAALTMAMRDSGDVLDWSDVDGPIVDKHSSGGVGDKVSLMLAPMIAACGGQENRLRHHRPNRQPSPCRQKNLCHPRCLRHG